MSTINVVTTRPAVLPLEAAAAYTSLSPTLLQEATRTDPDFPRPIQLSARRVGWLVAELDAWLATRPRSQCLPPVNSGYGRAGKPAAASS